MEKRLSVRSCATQPETTHICQKAQFRLKIPAEIIEFTGKQG